MNINNSTDLIAAAEAKFEELSHKGYEWKSFYSGFLEGFDATKRTCNWTWHPFLQENGLDFGIWYTECGKKSKVSIYHCEWCGGKINEIVIPEPENELGYEAQPGRKTE
jgi:hypothetical protein